VPALLSSRARTEQVCAQLEALGCLEADPNLEYLLLGDFADAPTWILPFPWHQRPQASSVGTARRRRLP